MSLCIFSTWICHATRRTRALSWQFISTAVSITALITLSACGKNDEGKTVGQKVDAAIAQSEQAAALARTKTENALSDAESNLKKAAQQAEISSENMAKKAEDKFDNISITAAVMAKLAKEPGLSAFKVNVSTKNGVVLLKGSAPTAEARNRALHIAKTAKGVTSVKNEMVVEND